MNDMSQASLPSSFSSQAEVAPFPLVGETPISPINEPILFATEEHKVDSELSFGYAMRASHDNRFGKNVMYLRQKLAGRETPRLFVLDEAAYLTQILIEMSPFVICLIGQSGCGKGNFSVQINDDHSLTLLIHAPCFTEEPTLLTLSCAQLKKIRDEYMWTMQLQLRFLDKIALLVHEAFHDILAEARIEAQKGCRACNSERPHITDHVCISFPAKTLDLVMSGALHIDEKAPVSTAMTKIYKRLVPHKEFFESEFRRSMKVNEDICETYKVRPFDPFVI
jgi:hypothetical protein